MKQYFYNERTHRLHIKGYCKESKMLPYHVRLFDTYDEALAFDGRCVGLCKACAKHENKLQKGRNITMALYRCAACGSPNVVTDTQIRRTKVRLSERRGWHGDTWRWRARQE